MDNQEEYIVGCYLSPTGIEFGKQEILNVNEGFYETTKESRISYERIRSMNDEEMQEFLYNLCNECYDLGYDAAY